MPSEARQAGSDGIAALLRSVYTQNALQEINQIIPRIAFRLPSAPP
ncbi:hypothetical protein ACFX50_03165 [Neisseria meningitidis]